VLPKAAIMLATVASTPTSAIEAPPLKWEQFG
jgi:hypothetical protein